MLSQLKKSYHTLVDIVITNKLKDYMMDEAEADVDMDNELSHKIIFTCNPSILLEEYSKLLTWQGQIELNSMISDLLPKLSNETDLLFKSYGIDLRLGSIQYPRDMKDEAKFFNLSNLIDDINNELPNQTTFFDMLRYQRNTEIVDSYGNLGFISYLTNLLREVYYKDLEFASGVDLNFYILFNKLYQLEADVRSIELSIIKYHSYITGNYEGNVNIMDLTSNDVNMSLSFTFSEDLSGYKTSKYDIIIPIIGNNAYTNKCKRRVIHLTSHPKRYK